MQWNTIRRRTVDPRPRSRWGRGWGAAVLTVALSSQAGCGERPESAAFPSTTRPDEAEHACEIAQLTAAQCEELGRQLDAMDRPDVGPAEVGVAVRRGQLHLVLGRCDEEIIEVTLMSTQDTSALMQELGDAESREGFDEAVSSADRVVRIDPASFIGNPAAITPLTIDVSAHHDFGNDRPGGWVYFVRTSGGSTRSTGLGRLPEGPWPEYPEISTADGSDQTSSVDEIAARCARKASVTPTSR